MFRLVTFAFLFVFAWVAYGEDDVKPEKALRDPTQPLSFVKKKASVKLTLQAIMNKGGKPKAIINGVLLGEGDIYKSRKIKRILDNRVEYEVNGQTAVLTLRPKLFKKGK